MFKIKIGKIIIIIQLIPPKIIYKIK